MIERKVFGTIVGPMFLHFKTTVYSDMDTLALIDTYYGRLKYQDELVLGKAIDLLIDTHPMKAMPTVAEINSAIAAIKQDMPKEQHYGLECQKCSGMGLYVDESDMLAKTCSCPKGQTRRANLAAWDKTHGYYKSPVRFLRQPKDDPDGFL